MSDIRSRARSHPGSPLSRRRSSYPALMTTYIQELKKVRFLESTGVCPRSCLSFVFAVLPQQCVLVGCGPAPSRFGDGTSPQAGRPPRRLLPNCLPLDHHSPPTLLPSCPLATLSFSLLQCPPPITPSFLLLTSCSTKEGRSWLRSVPRVAEIRTLSPKRHSLIRPWLVS